MLNELAEEIREVNEANGWRVFNADDADGWADPYRFVAIVGLIHTEASEAIEAFRVDDRQNALEELADVVIRTLDLAGGITKDFDSVVREKIEKNKTRGHRHGGKRV